MTNLPTTVAGTVTRFKGDGRKLGYPTANITTQTDLQDGVYFGYASLASWKHQPALIFIGTPTTMGETTRRIEAHLLDIPDQDYYDQELNLSIEYFHRGNRKFASVKALVRTMKTDESAIKGWLREPKNLAQTSLDYDDQSDDIVYINKIINVGSSKKVRLQAVTKAGVVGRPNEDSFAVVTNGNILLAAVFDGSTSLKPIADLKDQTGARFASHFLKQELSKIDLSQTPQKILLELNDRLLKKILEFEGTSLSDTHTLPSSLATIVKLDFKKKKLGFAHVGDSYAITQYRNGKTKLLTDDKVRPFDESVQKLMQEIAQERHISLRATRDDPRIQQAFIDMYQTRNNNPNGLGSGFVNGDPNLKLYVQAEETTLKDIQSILLGTDGLTPQGWSVENPQDRIRFFETLKSGGTKRLIAIKLKSEDDDPDWQHIRFKHSDDATALMVSL